jgi:hypothetical protein
MSYLRFVRKIERYFIRTAKGAQRADWIVPAPFFSSSHLSIPIQVADVCIYCINWGFRRNTGGMSGPVRDEIVEQFGGWIDRLAWQEKTQQRDGTIRKLFGIVFVKNPYGSGKT